VTLVLTRAGGTIAVPDAVLVGIATRAAERVEGIRVRRRRTVDLDERLVRLAVEAPRGEPLVELAVRTQQEVAAALRQMCELEVKVDIAIGELA
jgi:uncharacterized alkaline shock family protein YloU